MKGLRGYSCHVSFSDHYLVGTFVTPDEDRGPWFWCMPNDALSCPETIQQIQLILDNFDSKTLVNSWELIKVKVQQIIQQNTKFRQKQLTKEIKALRSSLTYVNKRIFLGENLEQDHLLLQQKIHHLLECSWFFDDETKTDVDWILHEGKMVKSFLHLEDSHMDSSIHALAMNQCLISESSDIIPYLYDFYTKSDQEIKAFWRSCPFQRLSRILQQ